MSQAEITEEQKLRAESHAIAMQVIQESMADAMIDWSFEGRRRLETRIERELSEKVYQGNLEDSPRVRLVRDSKTKLVSLELKPRQKNKKGWKYKK